MRCRTISHETENYNHIDPVNLVVTIEGNFADVQ